MPGDAEETPEFQFRHRSLLVILGCVLGASIATLCVSGAWLFTALDRLVLSFIVVKNALLFVWLWRRPRALVRVGVIELLLEGIGGVGKLWLALMVEHTAYSLGGYSYWLMLNYFIAALVWRGRAALWVSLGWFAVLLTLGGLYWFSSSIPLSTKQQYGNTLLQLYLTHATLIAFLTLQGRLLGQYLAAIVRAEGAARFAHVDGLTGTANRRQLEAWLRARHEHAGRTGEPWSVILFDLDHFKGVNDTYGHAAGDRVLQATAAAVRQALWEGDQMGRWGGEEFLVILPGTGPADAVRVAERLQEAVTAVEYPDVGRVTISCGVAQQAQGESVEALLHRADEALYAAKRGGRALVEVAW